MSLHEKLLAVHRAIGGAVKRDSTNPHFKNRYASLLSVINATGPHYADQGLYIEEKLEYAEGVTALAMRIVDSETGEASCWSRYPIIPVKNDPQGQGSALTYARRYLRMTICGLAPLDDDGEAATWGDQPPKADHTPANEQKRKLWAELSSVAEKATLTKVAAECKGKPLPAQIEAIQNALGQLDQQLKQEAAK